MAISDKRRAIASNFSTSGYQPGSKFRTAWLWKPRPLTGHDCSVSGLLVGGAQSD